MMTIASYIIFIQYLFANHSFDSNDKDA